MKIKFNHKWLVINTNKKIIKRYSYLFKGVVYDLGCGDKPYKQSIEKAASKYIGVDWSETYHNKVMDINADLNKPLPIDSDVADTVVSFQVIEHLKEPQTFVEESFRILKSGGIFFLTVPFQWHIHEDPYDYFRYTKYGLKYMLQKAGYTEIRIMPIGGFWFTMANKLCYQSTRWIKGFKIIRYIIKSILIVFWFFIQRVSLILDKIDFNERETSGYAVIAYKRK